MPSTSLQKLMQIPLCRGLTELEASQILVIAEETSLRRGDVVFNEGDPGDSLYLLLDGTLEILKKDKAGESLSLAKLSDGSVVGEMGLLSGQAPRSATAVAESDARLLKLSGARFMRLLAEDNLAALKMVRNLAQVMSRRLQLMDEKLVELAGLGRKKEELADFQRILNNWSF